MSIPPVAESVTSHTQMNPPRPSRWPIFAAAAVVLVLGTGAVAAVGGMALGLGGKNEGTVVVTASGVGGRAIDGVRVIVDGVQKCNASPCRVDGLAAGTRLIHAEAPGFEPTAARAVSVESGAESALHVELLPVAKAEPDAPASAKADEPSPAKADEPSPAKADAPAAAQAKAAAPAAAKAPVAAAPGAKASTGKKDETKAADAPQPAAMGTLNVNSIPRSNVVVNGRPMGMTPVMGLSVPAGPQTVVFVHPELGRKVGSASVQAGGSATIAVRFE